MLSFLSARRGFTLIEVLVTVTIISLLTVMGAVSYRQTAIASRDAKRSADLETVRQALVLYKTDNGNYPIYSGSSTGSNFDNMLSTLVSAGAITNSQNIVDPKEGVSPYDYGYQSNVSGSTFSLTARLEKDGSTLTLTNP